MKCALLPNIVCQMQAKVVLLDLVTVCNYYTLVYVTVLQCVNYIVNCVNM